MKLHFLLPLLFALHCPLASAQSIAFHNAAIGSNINLSVSPSAFVNGVFYQPFGEIPTGNGFATSIRETLI